MKRKQLQDTTHLSITLKRLAWQLIEAHDKFQDSVIIGLQPRGIEPAARICTELETLLGKPVPYGKLDATFFRDDFRRRTTPLKPNATEIPFLIERKRVILIDDVLYTGRTVRAALDAMIAFGRPESVELLVLVDRNYSRELPIEATYSGYKINTLKQERVLLEWASTSNDIKEDSIWLIEASENNG